MLKQDVNLFVYNLRSIAVCQCQTSRKSASRSMKYNLSDCCCTFCCVTFHTFSFCCLSFLICMLLCMCVCVCMCCSNHITPADHCASWLLWPLVFQRKFNSPVVGMESYTSAQVITFFEIVSWFDLCEYSNMFFIYRR